MTASAVFSATDSTAARHSCGPSSLLGSRPTRVGASVRARSRSRSPAVVVIGPTVPVLLSGRQRE